MARRFGVGIWRGTAVPHFSYHIAKAYEIERLGEILEQMAGEMAVITYAGHSNLQ